MRLDSLPNASPGAVSYTYRRQGLLVRQAVAVLLQRRPLPPPSPRFRGWTSDAVRDALSSIPTYFFLSPRSVGRQRTSGRHRSPLRQRCLRLESSSSAGSRGPAKHRDLESVGLGVAAGLEFYSWVESHCGFPHDELTCRDMSRVLARANRLPLLWRFLRSNERLVSTATVTEVIKLLGEEGLTREALAAFYRMKQLHCKPDAQSYNTIISALCRVGLFKKARILLDQMELPGARCRPDTFTYTILISSYCKRSLQTGCRKAITRRIWEANHMFRRMLFNGFVPDVVTYNCLIDGLCKTYRIERAHELLDDMLVKGCSPNRITYNSFIRYYSVVNQIDKAVEMMRAMVSRSHGVPSSSSYTPVIHALCETGRVREARDLLVEMVSSGSIPREFTYKLVCDGLAHAGEQGLDDELHRRIEDGMRARFMQVRLLKPVMGNKSIFAREQQ
ncbi:pentatricopeptide repeat-containing protein At1g77405-like [Zingiber officinale]|uniref:Pentatricopeptide repeat-containing protein n=1 Tax=Zingiber officinale TaxID=94328 RepID=A0A8J5KMU7_ZINOF|nr:pentatricopeptide repeat-containing protein At1g77405-like [Zingiber officinale]KAG6493621.1 hypothetical protein ZIOFF_048613 [Zingiber officinale]